MKSHKKAINGLRKKKKKKKKKKKGRKEGRKEKERKNVSKTKGDDLGEIQSIFQRPGGLPPIHYKAMCKVNPDRDPAEHNRALPRPFRRKQNPAQANPFSSTLLTVPPVSIVS